MLIPGNLLKGGPKAFPSYCVICT